MPIYQYKCPECKQMMNKIQSFSAEKTIECDTCSAIAKRILPTSFTVRFKGDGWASTSGVIKEDD